MKLINKKKNGIALITVLLLISVLLVFGIAIIEYANSDLILAISCKDVIASEYLAKSGIKYVSENCKDWWEKSTEDINEQKTLDTGYFTIKASLNYDNTITVESTGFCEKRSKKLIANLKRDGTVLKWYQSN